MVTNVGFTDGAKETALEPGRQLVHLVDGAELINIMVAKAIGVRQIEMGVLDIDEDFWSQAAYEA
jgi:restriction endonuclease Mrr